MGLKKNREQMYVYNVTFQADGGDYKTTDELIELRRPSVKCPAEKNLCRGNFANLAQNKVHYKHLNNVQRKRLLFEKIIILLE